MPEMGLRRAGFRVPPTDPVHLPTPRDFVLSTRMCVHVPWRRSFSACARDYFVGKESGGLLFLLFGKLGGGIKRYRRRELFCES